MLTPICNTEMRLTDQYRSIIANGKAQAPGRFREEDKGSQRRHHPASRCRKHASRSLARAYNSRKLRPRSAEKVLKSLETLDLSGTSVSNEGLAHLTGLPRLRVLRLAGLRQVDDAGVRIVASIESLEELDISGTDVSANTLRELPVKRIWCGKVEQRLAP